jgi:hypothetical protein
MDNSPDDEQPATSIDGVIRPIKKSEPTFATDADIAAIGEGVLAGTHPYLNWTHLAHCAATLYLLLRKPEWVLEEKMPEIIRKYNSAIGVANTDTTGYHETLTIFYIRAIRDFLATEGKGLGPAMALAALRQSPIGIREFVFDFYSREQLFSTTARREWVEPDIKPLTF